MAYMPVNICMLVCRKDNQPDRFLHPLKSPHMDPSPIPSSMLELTSEMCLAFSGRVPFKKYHMNASSLLSLYKSPNTEIQTQRPAEISDPK